jgi:hypothetical protein
MSDDLAKRAVLEGLLPIQPGDRRLEPDEVIALLVQTGLVDNTPDSLEAAILYLIESGQVTPRQIPRPTGGSQMTLTMPAMMATE